MIATIEKGTAYGRVEAPPSKSVSHRYLICGALSGGSVIENVAFSEDIKATLNCLKALGADYEIDGSTVKIGGISPDKAVKSTELFCNESGSTLRFLIPLCLLFGQKITLKGTERLMSRSLAVYKDMCLSQGIEFSEDKESVTVCGNLRSGKYSVRGDVSSQFISGLMFALPLLENDSIIDITGAIESGSYLGMTVKALADFGIRISRTDEHTVFIKGNQTYKPRTLCVEGDYSNAAFFEAFNSVGGNVAVTGLKKDTCQGDAVYRKLFGKLVRGCPEIDISDCPDLAPVLMAVAAANNGVRLTGTHRLKIKESDRGKAMAEELSKFGCSVKVYENEIEVKKHGITTPTDILSGHNDHRIVMALSLLCSITGGSISGAEAVNKSFPDYFRRLSSLGIKVEEK
ncbi:MAG TPA: 3-phosphoshikimate 1-carboxyvinyltransferase [Ruminococcaceae bacterium]|nr:3-phosphoshikimate 1-carboxyvinyltransferase [Oscillospiraceae bacterium]